MCCVKIFGQATEKNKYIMRKFLWISVIVVSSNDGFLFYLIRNRLAKKNRIFLKLKSKTRREESFVVNYIFVSMLNRQLPIAVVNSKDYYELSYIFVLVLDEYAFFDLLFVVWLLKMEMMRFLFITRSNGFTWVRGEQDNSPLDNCPPDNYLPTNSP